MQQTSLITVCSALEEKELAANTIDNSHRLSCRREEGWARGNGSVLLVSTGL